MDVPTLPERVERAAIRAIVASMSDGSREPDASVGSPRADRTAAPATVSACHPDLVCPVCTARGKTVRMHPVKAHYQCPECHYFDSCCM